MDPDTIQNRMAAVAAIGGGLIAIPIAFSVQDDLYRLFLLGSIPFALCLITLAFVKRWRRKLDQQVPGMPHAPAARVGPQKEKTGAVGFTVGFIVLALLGLAHVAFLVYELAHLHADPGRLNLIVVFSLSLLMLILSTVLLWVLQRKVTLPDDRDVMRRTRP